MLDVRLFFANRYNGTECRSREAWAVWPDDANIWNIKTISKALIWDHALGTITASTNRNWNTSISIWCLQFKLIKVPVLPLSWHARSVILFDSCYALFSYKNNFKKENYRFFLNLCCLDRVKENTCAACWCLCTLSVYLSFSLPYTRVLGNIT